MTRRYAVADLLQRLQKETIPVGTENAGLAFDGDGTLWSGDVGDDLFFFALEQGLLKEDARPALERVARDHGFEPAGSVNDLARSIYDAHLERRVPQPVAYAMMAWCFAGYSLPEVSALAAEALSAARIDTRLHHELSPILEWAHREGVRTIVVSASPHPVVELAAARWNVHTENIAAVRPKANAAGRIEPELSGAVPYGQEKTRMGRELLGPARWVAAFGDNGFDAAMLTAARIGVAVRPKPALRDLLPDLDGVVELIA